MKVIDALLSGIYDALKTTTTGALDGAKLRLYTNTVDLAGDVVLGDFTVPTFTGYADAAITWANHTDAEGHPYLDAGPMTFSPSDGVDLPQAVVGCLILNSSNALMAAMEFESPIALNFAGQQLVCNPFVSLVGDVAEKVSAYTE